MLLLYSAMIFCAGFRSILNKQNGRMNGEPSLFNFSRAFSAFILFLILTLISSYQIHYPTIVYGTIYGILFCGSCFSGLQALARGPLSITSSLVAFSLVLPCVFGAVYLDETISAFDILGFVFIIGAILLMNKKDTVKKQEQQDEMKFKKGWAVYITATIIFDGLHAIVKTLHQKNFPGLYRYEFMCIGMFIGMIVFAFLTFKNRSIIKERGKKLTQKGALYGIVAGIANGMYNYLVLCLSGLENATALFPIVSVSTIAVSLISGRLLFKERLNKIQICGVLFAATAIFFIKI